MNIKQLPFHASQHHDPEHTKHRVWWTVDKIWCVNDIVTLMDVKTRTLHVCEASEFESLDTLTGSCSYSICYWVNITLIVDLGINMTWYMMFFFNLTLANSRSILMWRLLQCKDCLYNANTSKRLDQDNYVMWCMHVDFQFWTRTFCVQNWVRNQHQSTRNNRMHLTKGDNCLSNVCQIRCVPDACKHENYIPLFCLQDAQ